MISLTHLSRVYRTQDLEATALNNIKPKLILADEATGHLDSRDGDEVMTMLRESNRDGTTVIMVTHFEKEGNYAVRVVRLPYGQIMVDQTSKTSCPAEVA